MWVFFFDFFHDLSWGYFGCSQVLLGAILDSQKNPCSQDDLGAKHLKYNCERFWRPQEMVGCPVFPLERIGGNPNLGNNFFS